MEARMRQWMLSAGIIATIFVPVCSIADEATVSQPLPKSAKERLSDKASDEQRVNNCRVPLDRRGSTPRPDCPPVQAGEPPTSDTAAAPR
jgi:hypothetical protein